MYQYLGRDFGTPFELFGTAHLTVLAIIAIYNVLMAINLKRTKNTWVNKQFRYTLAVLLIIQEVSLNLWYVYTGQWDIGASLPLHLCGMGLILSAIMLVNDSYSIFEVTYFWGLAGATQALLTPDIADYGFPHYRFFQFFVSHGAIVTANIYMTFVRGYRPTWKSLRKAIVVTVLYTIVIAGFNWLVDGNYLFICHKPPTASLLDIMGPWPWYLIPLTFVAVAIFALFYSPYAVKDWLTQQKTALAQPTPKGE
jgi:hypothetical integral membrane protein (TIGR02206 family)